MIKKIKTKIKKIFSVNHHKRSQLHCDEEFLKRFSWLKERKKIIYSLTPPVKHTNVGDQAQVVAIYKWIRDNFHGVPIIEFDKSQCISKVDLLKKIITKNDLILLHSGGNMGDRYMWSENGRRNIIKNFPHNKIIQLPQTIFFHDNENGRKELQISKEIYCNHKNLKIIARDYESERIGKKNFPEKVEFAIPDFVTYLAGHYDIKTETHKKDILFCIRKDPESNIKEKELDIMLNSTNGTFEVYDTTRDYDIPREKRESELIKALKYFQGFRIIVTDRYHGLIFSAILKKPTIVLPTVDHKLTSAIEWFQDLPYIKLIEKDQIVNLDEIGKQLKKLNREQSIDWAKVYFNGLKERLLLTSFFNY